MKYALNLMLQSLAHASELERHQMTDWELGSATRSYRRRGYEQRRRLVGDWCEECVALPFCVKFQSIFSFFNFLFSRKPDGLPVRLVSNRTKTIGFQSFKQIDFFWVLANSNQIEPKMLVRLDSLSSNEVS